MKTITLVFLAIAASAASNTANANEVQVMEVVVVTAKRIEQPATKLSIATEVAAPAIDFSKLSIQAPKLYRDADGEAPNRIELAIGSREISNS